MDGSNQRGNFLKNILVQKCNSEEEITEKIIENIEKGELVYSFPKLGDEKRIELINFLLDESGELYKRLGNKKNYLNRFLIANVLLSEYNDKNSKDYAIAYILVHLKDNTSENNNLQKALEGISTLNKENIEKVLDVFFKVIEKNENSQISEMKKYFGDYFDIFRALLEYLKYYPHDVRDSDKPKFKENITLSLYWLFQFIEALKSNNITKEIFSLKKAEEHLLPTAIPLEYIPDEMSLSLSIIYEEMAKYYLKFNNLIDAYIYFNKAHEQLESSVNLFKISIEEGRKLEELKKRIFKIKNSVPEDIFKDKFWEYSYIYNRNSEEISKKQKRSIIRNYIKNIKRNLKDNIALTGWYIEQVYNMDLEEEEFYDDLCEFYYFEYRFNQISENRELECLVNVEDAYEYYFPKIDLEKSDLSLYDYFELLSKISRKYIIRGGYGDHADLEALEELEEKNLEILEIYPNDPDFLELIIDNFIFIHTVSPKVIRKLEFKKEVHYGRILEVGVELDEKDPEATDHLRDKRIRRVLKALELNDRLISYRLNIENLIRSFIILTELTSLYEETNNKKKSDFYYKKSMDLYKFMTENFSRKEIEDGSDLVLEAPRSSMERVNSSSLDYYYLKNIIYMINSNNYTKFSVDISREAIEAQDRLLNSRNSIFFDEFWEILNNVITYADNTKNTDLGIWASRKFYDFYKGLNSTIARQNENFSFYFYKALKFLFENDHSLNPVETYIEGLKDNLNYLINIVYEYPKEEPLSSKAIDKIDLLFNSFFLVVDYNLRSKNFKIAENILKKTILKKLNDLSKLYKSEEFLKPYWKKYEEFLIEIKKS